MGSFTWKKEILLHLEQTRILSQMARNPQAFETHYLRDSGNSRDMNVNGSVTPVMFEYVATRDLFISDIVISGVDSTIDFTGFFGRAILANGITGQVLDENDTPLLSLNNGEPLKQTMDLLPLGSVATTIVKGSTEDSLTTDITTGGAGGALLMLHKGYKIRSYVRDDLTSLLGFRVVLRGVATLIEENTFHK